MKNRKANAVVSRALVFAGLVAFGGVYYFQETARAWSIFALAVFALLSFWTALWLARHDTAMRKVAAKMFGIKEIPSGSGAWRVKRLFQPQVNRVLYLRAKEMQEAFDAENTFLSSPHVDGAVALERLVHLVVVSQNVKRTFWRAHRAAKYFGFVVRKSYKDYLPVPRPKQTARA